MENKLSDQWQTPDELFQELNKEFNFDIDLCATADNSKCDRFFQDYFTGEFYKKEHTENGLKFVGPYNVNDYKNKLWERYPGLTCFMNPPYSNPKPFIEKAWEDSKHCKIVCLVKCDPSTRWWATFWNYSSETCEYCFGRGWKYFHGLGTTMNCDKCLGPKPGCEVRFFPKRIQFDPPQQLIDSGEVWRLSCKQCDEYLNIIVNIDGYPLNTKCLNNHKWVQRCRYCNGDGDFVYGPYPEGPEFVTCGGCKGTGYKQLSGPTFPCALIIMDRRNV